MSIGGRLFVVLLVVVQTTFVAGHAMVEVVPPQDEVVDFYVSQEMCDYFFLEINRGNAPMVKKCLMRGLAII